MNKFLAKTGINKLIVIRSILFLAFCFFNYLQLQISSLASVRTLFHANIILNVFLLGAFELLIYSVCRRSPYVNLAFSLWVTIYSIAAHYVFVFHGSPLSSSELANFSTALSVMGNYKYKIDKYVLAILLLLCVELLIFFIDRYFSKKEIKSAFSFKKLIFPLILAVYLALLFKYFKFANITDMRTYAVKNFGYVAFFAEDLKVMANPLIMPQEYSAEKITYAPVPAASTNIVKPNIILILNESFSDLSYVCNIQTDVDYMEGFYNIPNTGYGIATVPWSGGGTNNSEYELLTSNDFSLLYSAAPFNYMNLSESSSNNVAFLNLLGYETSAFHCFSAKNYSRDVGYAGLGFDNIYLGPECFSYKNTYGNRLWLDSDNFHDLTDRYEACDHNNPQFMYLLTYQNHGGYNQNDSSYDIVHLEHYEGILEEEINEYLTSIYFGSQAFGELIDYFSNIGQPTVVCMVGDHSASLVNDLVSEDSEEEVHIRKRMVPYAIWNNLGLDFSKYTEATITDIMPIIFKEIGFRLTPYQNTILEIRETVPYRCNYGIYKDYLGNYDNTYNNKSYLPMLNQYYYMEYNGLKQGKDYIKELFE